MELKSAMIMKHLEINKINKTLAYIKIAIFLKPLVT